MDIGIIDQEVQAYRSLTKRYRMSGLYYVDYSVIQCSSSGGLHYAIAFFFFLKVYCDAYMYCNYTFPSLNRCMTEKRTSRVKVNERY